MPKDPENINEDFSLFQAEFGDISPIKQDKIPPRKPDSKQNQHSSLKKRQDSKELKRAAADFHFSDGFEAHFPENSPLKFTRDGTDTFEVKRLRRGEYPPDLILDLHGLNKQQSKLEISALIQAAQKQHAYCVCIVHGVSGQTLKKAVPSWLVQHPAILAFHQAPLEWGGQGALLALVAQK